MLLGKSDLLYSSWSCGCSVLKINVVHENFPPCKWFILLRLFFFFCIYAIFWYRFSFFFFSFLIGKCSAAAFWNGLISVFLSELILKSKKLLYLLLSLVVYPGMQQSSVWIIMLSKHLWHYHQALSQGWKKKKNLSRDLREERKLST